MKEVLHFCAGFFCILWCAGVIINWSVRIKTGAIGSTVKESSDNKLQTPFTSSLLIAEFCTVLFKSLFLLGLASLSFFCFCFRCCQLSVPNFNFYFDGNFSLLWSSLKKTISCDGTFLSFLLVDTRCADFCLVLERTICLLLLNLRVLTGKKHRQIKLQRLQKVRMWAFGSLVYQINYLW